MMPRVPGVIPRSLRMQIRRCAADTKRECGSATRGGGPLLAQCHTLSDDAGRDPESCERTAAPPAGHVDLPRM